MTIAACYDLQLECDGDGCIEENCRRGDYDLTRANFTGEFCAGCRRRARKAGWKMFKNGSCLCPSCVKRGAEVHAP